MLLKMLKMLQVRKLKKNKTKQTKQGSAQNKNKKKICPNNQEQDPKILLLYRDNKFYILLN